METGRVIHGIDIEHDTNGMILVLTSDCGAEVVVERIRLGTRDTSETARLLERAARQARSAHRAAA